MNINTRHKFLWQKQPGSTKTVEGVTSSPVLMDPDTTSPAAVTQPRSLDTRGEAPAYMMAAVIFHIKNSHIHFWLRDPHYGCSIHNACWSTSLQQHDHKWSWWNKTGVWWNSAPQKMLEILFGNSYIHLRQLRTRDIFYFLTGSGWFLMPIYAHIVFYPPSQRTLSLSCSGIQILCPLSSWCRHTVLSKMYSLGTIGKQISECFASCVHKRHHISRYWCFILKPLLADTDDVPILSCIKYIWYKKGEAHSCRKDWNIK